MDKKECLKLIEQYFHIKSFINKFKNPDFKLKSHIFYYREIFKEVDEIRMLRVASKNIQDDIILDIYYVSKSFEGLFNGYFKIHPISTTARKIFGNVSNICTDLGYYFYYVYQNSDLLKKYLISGNLENTMENHQKNDFKTQFDRIKKETYMDIAKYDMKEIENIFLNREKLKKYITNFIRLNGKCSEEVKMFLIQILSDQYKNNLCFINSEDYLNTFIKIDTKSIYLNNHPKVPIYGLMDYATQEHFILFLKLEIYFEGGD
ncbi:hypothetical protein [Marinisporobacter balticus]|uniref:Uncharacterized protein n=1 Tax=Marinisporobacter balticus TaxID=2018667 RepID=A0A4R2L4F0_9FIRM|nr:hypothetical protein [Marinisporobacter balticus]TCO78716.1 hypothetical protein EV214_104103 [Marinisporobacter balticus]